MLHKLLSIILVMLLSVLPAAADTLTIPNSFTDGTTASATQVNANFTAITTVVNGNIANANIKSAAAISLSKLDLTTELFVLRTAAERCISAGTTGDTVPRVGFDSSGRIFFGPGSATATDLLIKRTDANTLAIRNAGDSADKDLTVGAITGSGAASFDSLSLTTKLTAGNGGTGNNITPSVGTMLVGDGTKFVTIGPGTLGQVPVSDGTTIAMGSASGTLSFTYSSKTASFSATAGNAYGVDSSSGAVVCTLPTAASIAGQEIIVSLRTAGNNLTFNTTSSQTIDGQASGAIVTAVRYNTYRFMSDGANWMIM